MDRILQVRLIWSQLPTELRQQGIAKTPEQVEARRRRVNEASKRTRLKHLIASRLRSRIAFALKRSGARKQGHSIDYLGCTESEYRAYLEQRFTEGMSWEAFDAGEIHVDHIVPVSHFGDSEAELRRAFHYTNTQPMWAWDNYSKGAQLSGAVQPDLFLPVLTKPDLRRHCRRRPLN
jgi:hypothetical protein